MINFEYLLKAQKKVDPGAWHYLCGGAEDELALLRNRQAFQNWAFLPHVLRDVSRVDTRCRLLDLELDSPFIGAPVGGLTLFHKEGEVEWARGLKQAGVLGVLSGVSRIEHSRVIKDSGCDKLWYQLYYFGDDAWIRDQVQTAEVCGYRAIVVTLDVAYYAQRERDLLRNYNARTEGWRTSPLPPDQARVASLNWSDLEKLKTFTKLPIVLKGIVREEDIRKAARLGVKGVWISNHGGRQLDHTPASLDLLLHAEPVCRELGLSVIFDGGVRRGSDAFLALCLGADAVALGRLPIFGLAAEGAEGVASVFKNALEELKTTMGLSGCASLSEDRPRPIRVSSHPIATKWERIELNFDSTRSS